MSKLIINGKNAVPVSALDQLKSHGIGSVLTVFDATGRTESAFAAERNEFKIAAFGAGIHCAAKRGIPTLYHLVNVINDSLPGMQTI